jgi:hypothetical protein
VQIKKEVATMSRMVELIDELRQRLSTIVASEQTVLTSLRDALNRVDQTLLQDVRNITAEHEARRGVILRELQVLASSIGTFATSRIPRELPKQDQQPGLPAGAAAEDAALGRSANKLARELDIYFKKRRASV